MQNEIVDFAKNFLQLYLVENDFDKIEPLLADNIIWINSESNQFANGLSDTLSAITHEFKTQKTSLTISQQTFSVNQIDTNSYVVFCEFCAYCKPAELEMLETVGRLSITIKNESNALKLVCFHFSAQDILNRDNEPTTYAELLKDNYIMHHIIVKQLNSLSASNAKLNSLVSNMQVGILIADLAPTFPIQVANDGLKKMLAIPQKSDLTDATFIDFIHPADKHIVEEKLYSTLISSQKSEMEYRMIAKNNKVIWVISSASVFNNELGVPSVHCILTDITKQKEQEEHLRKINHDLIMAKEKYEFAFKHANIFIFEYLFDTDEITHSSNFMYEEFGLPYKIKNPIKAVENFAQFPKDGKENLKNLLSAIKYGEKNKAIKLTVKDSKTGNELPINVSMNTIFDLNSKPISAIGMITDATIDRMFENQQKINDLLQATTKTTLIVNLSKDMVTSTSTSLREYPHENYHELIQTLAASVVYKNDASIFAKTLNPKALISNFANKQFFTTLEYRRKNNEGIEWHKVQATLIRDSVSKDILCYLIEENIDEIKKLEIKKEEENEYYKLMLNKALTVFEVDFTNDLYLGGYKQWNNDSEIGAFVEYSKVINHIAKNFVHPDDKQLFSTALSTKQMKNIIAEGKNESVVEYRRKLTKTAESYTWLRAITHLIENPVNNSFKGLIYVIDITNEKKREKTLLYKSTHDGLTDLLNKTAARLEVESFIHGEHDSSLLPALLMIDVDNFKKLNDSLGHTVGDKFLVYFANELKNIFINSSIIGRFGGDEFVIVTKNTKDTSEITDLCNRVIQMVEKIRLKSNNNIPLSASIGIALFDKNGATYDELCANADKALYTAKTNGKGRFCYVGENNLPYLFK